MNCSELSDLLYAFVDGELSVEQNVACLKHAELCPACAARVTRERDLRGVIERSAKEPAGEGTRALVAAALDRVEAEQAPRGTSRWVTLAAAALLLAACGAGTFAYLHPCSWRACPTLQLAEAAARAAQDEPTLSLIELEASFPRPLVVPAACGIEVEGGQLVAASGAPPRPLLRVRCRKTGCRLLFLHVPEGHTHFWQRKTRPDGRVYLEAHTPSGLRLVGWPSKDGVFVCLAEKDVRPEVILAMAAALRDSVS